MFDVLLSESGAWHWWFAPFWILFWIALVVLFFRFAPWGRYRDRRLHARGILAERFARGEIDAAEYRSRLDVLNQ